MRFAEIPERIEFECIDNTLMCYSCDHRLATHFCKVDSTLKVPLCAECMNLDEVELRFRLGVMKKPNLLMMDCSELLVV